MSAAPRVSVLIPCRDHGAWLPEAVESVLAQTFADSEIRIVDDGSTDPPTLERLAAASWPRTTVLRSPPRGVARARNLALEGARGEFVCALDADDRLHASFLEKAVGVLDADPAIGFVSSWIRAFGAEQWDWRPRRADLPALLAEDTVHTAALARTALVRAAGGWDPGMHEEGLEQGYEDWDLWLTLVERGARGAILEETLLDYRRRPGAMSERCCAPEAHLALTAWLRRKHGASYRARLDDVLDLKDEELGRLLRENDAVEREIAGWLAPAAASLEAEAARLRAGLEAVRAAEAGRAAERTLVHRLDAERHRALGEIEALRGSWSWRLTAPLRAGLDWLRGGRR